MIGSKKSHDHPSNGHSTHPGGVDHHSHRAIDPHRVTEACSDPWGDRTCEEEEGEGVGGHREGRVGGHSCRDCSCRACKGKKKLA